MKERIRQRKALGFILITSILFLATHAQADSRQVPRWEPHDFSFRAADPTNNPFNVVVSADLVGPQGIHYRLPGFYDGNNIWKVRVSATAEGIWSLTTRSSLSSLDKQQASFTCIPNPSSTIHGGLRVDPRHSHRFIMEDGSHLFPMGYECDWLWALDTDDDSLKTVNPFLDRIASCGFNFVILDSYAFDTSWRKGRTGTDDFGPPPLRPWEGSNDSPDYRHFSLPYWHHFDQIIDALYRRGLGAHVLIRVYNKQVHWPPNSSPEDDQFYLWLVARYAAYPNITWDIAKEAQYEKDTKYKIDRLRYLHAIDPYHRLLTIHDDKSLYDRGVYDSLVDFRSDQQHTEWRQTMLAHLQQHNWPVINTEFGYEHGPAGLSDKTYSKAQEPEELCRRAWEISMAGGYCVYYYTYSAWDVIRPKDNPPGYAYFKYLARFFDGTRFWELTPMAGVVSKGDCLANAGKEYIVYLNTAATFTMKIDGAARPLPIEWYLPLTGERVPGQSIGNGTVSLIPPAQVGTGPVALHVGPFLGQ